VSKYVLDASAVLALLNQETGMDRVKSVATDSCISAVNYCEVLGKLIYGGMPENEALESVELLNVEVVNFDAELARLAAVLRPATKALGLSLGDRSCLALAMARSNTAMTADRAWSKLKVGVNIELVR
jgi:ribonuclease VapC